MAVGEYETGGYEQPLIEFWNGSVWRIEPASLPTGASGGWLYGVSCPSTATCTAVGTYYTSAGGPFEQSALAESWDGSSWSLQSTPAPTSTTSSSLNAVWCFSKTSCNAVGSNATDSGEETLAESWDGTSWSIQTTPNPSGSTHSSFANLSCDPGSSNGAPCKAVGSSEDETLIESWDGTKWGLDETPVISNADGDSFSIENSLNDVSCTSSKACTAVGSYLDNSIGAWLALAERWNGTSWTVEPTPDPPVVEADSTTDVAGTSATLNGMVWPDRATVTSCYFEYGTNYPLTSTVPCAQAIGAGTSPVSVTADLSGLTPNTTYYIALAATNMGGTATEDFSSSFTTNSGPPGGGTGSSGTGGGNSGSGGPVGCIGTQCGVLSSGGAGRYVAMGDSYSAGEGTGTYDRGTDTSTDKCHRSSEDISKASYPRLLQLDSPSVPSKLTFVACSGAVIDNILSTSRYGEPPQIQALGPDVTLVTLSIGGNDLGFSHVLEECVNEGPTHFRSDDTCLGQESELREKLWGPHPLNARLINLYRAINKRAPHARIVVMGYPRLFPLGSDNSCGLPGLRYLDSLKIVWLNQWSEILDTYLEEAVDDSGVAEYVSTLNAMTDSAGVDHSACGDSTPWINEVQLFHPGAWPDAPESFHPNPSGYVALANALLPTIDGAPSGRSFVIGQGQIVGPSVTVPPAASWLTVGVSWPGSTVATTLITPKGKVISPLTAAKVRGVQHEVGPTYELYSIPNPEPGHWQIRALGVSVAAGGEPLRISVRTEQRRHQPPIARGKARPTHGRTPLRVLFTSNGSHAVEGHIKQYLWSFGDGTHGKGRRVKHTYKRPGHYTALLDVIDTSGARTLASTNTIVVRR